MRHASRLISFTLMAGLFGAAAVAQESGDDPLPPGEVAGQEEEGDELDQLFRDLEATAPGQEQGEPVEEQPVDDREVVEEVIRTPVGEDGQPLDGETEVLLDEDGNPIEPEQPVMIPQEAYVQKGGANLRGLDKITGRFTDLKIAVGEPLSFGTLEIELKACYDTPPELPPEASSFLQIRSTRPLAPESMPAKVAARLEGKPENSDEVQRPLLFSGWMFASTPGLSALEHPVYDVWVISCTAS